MRKSVIITCLSLSGLMILDSINFGHILMLFIMTGKIPGTSLSMPATLMFVLMWSIAGIIIARFGIIPLTRKKT